MQGGEAVDSVRRRHRPQAAWPEDKRNEGNEDNSTELMALSE